MASRARAAGARTARGAGAFDRSDRLAGPAVTVTFAAVEGGA